MGTFSKQLLPNPWDVIERIAATLDLNDQKLAEMLQVTQNELNKLRSKKTTLPMDKAFHLTECLNLGFDQFATGKIDYPALAQHHLGNLNHLPEKYQKCALGSRRSGLMILNFIESLFGWRQRASILKNFQMNEAMFANADQPIGFSFAADLLGYLSRYKISNQLIPQIGAHSFLSAAPTFLKSELVDCKSVGEIYERMCDYIVEKYFEKNYSYRITKMESGNCVVFAKPNRLLIDQLGPLEPIKPETEMVRIGIASAYPTLLGLPGAQVKQSSSMWSGAPYIRYEINFEHAQMMMKKWKQSGLHHSSNLLN